MAKVTELCNSLRDDVEMFDLPACLKKWAINLFYSTATKEQKKMDINNLDLRLVWDDLFVEHQEPEYFDDKVTKLPGNYALFSNTFRNNTDSQQEYTFTAQRTTCSVAEVEIQRGVVLSSELSLKLSVSLSYLPIYGKVFIDSNQS